MRIRGLIRPILVAALTLAGAVGLSGEVRAQSGGGSVVRSPLVTLDQDRLFTESLFGQRLLAEIERSSMELAARNRAVTAELTVEERELTEKRKTMPAEEFRALADAFDEKVTQLREDQDARIRELQQRRDNEQREFTSRVLPVLADIVREVGALAILDERAVVLAAEEIDVTDRAIQRIDALLGDGGALEPAEAEGAGPEVGTPATDDAPGQD